MKRGCWSASAASVVGLTSLALVSGAGANHSVTDRVSTGPAGGNGPWPASSQGISVGGTHVWFTSSERLVSADTDGTYQDVYEHVGGTTSLVSIGSTAGSSNLPNASYAGAVWDGSRVFFTTPERLEPTDTDGMIDVYERSGGVTRLVSTPPIGAVAAAVDATFITASEDGSRVFFRTTESRWSRETPTGSRTSMSARAERPRAWSRSAPPAETVSRRSAALRLWTRSPSTARAPSFHTVESLVASDTDTMTDIYERAGGTTTLISTGPGASGGNGPYGVSFATASADGSRVIFMSDESLVDADADTCISLGLLVAIVGLLLFTAQIDSGRCRRRDHDDGVVTRDP